MTQEQIFHKPEFRYLTQNHDGIVRRHIEIPTKDQMAHEWVSDHMITVSEGARNPSWQNTLIDTESGESYTFDNGILKRADTGSDCGNDAAKDRYRL